MFKLFFFRSIWFEQKEILNQLNSWDLLARYGNII